MRHFFGTINGPEGTPYEGGLFRLELYLPDSYPMEPPKVLMITKIYHPNIDKLGTYSLKTKFSFRKNMLRCTERQI